MAATVRDNPTTGVYVTIRSRGGGKGKRSKNLTIYGVTVAEMAEIVRRAIEQQGKKRKSA